MAPPNRRPWSLLVCRKKLAARRTRSHVVMPQPPAPEIHEILTRAKALLVTDLQRPPSLDDLSQTVGLTKFRLSRLFRKVEGRSMPAILREHRMQRAAQLLAESGLNVGQIAVEVGYNSMSAFTRAFSREYRTTPEKFRAHCRQQPHSEVSDTS